MDPQHEFERAFMTGQLDPFDFVLAERLGMTVEEMLNRISNREYLMWRAFYRYRNEMERLEWERAKAEAQVKRGKR